MENRKILLYVLYGFWRTPYNEGTTVLGVSEEIEPLQKELRKIIDSRAIDYLQHSAAPEELEISERHFKIIDADRRCAKFYITEYYVELSGELMGSISREIVRVDRKNDIEEYLTGLWEGGNIEAWKYEYMLNCKEVIHGMVKKFEEYEDCNTSYNSTIELVVEDTMKSILLDDNVLEFLWKRFESIPVGDDGCVKEGFLWYEAGTDKAEICSWFKNHSKLCG